MLTLDFRLHQFNFIIIIWLEILLDYDFHFLITFSLVFKESVMKSESYYWNGKQCWNVEARNDDDGNRKRSVWFIWNWSWLRIRRPSLLRFHFTTRTISNSTSTTWKLVRNRRNLSPFSFVLSFNFSSLSLFLSVNDRIHLFWHLSLFFRFSICGESCDEWTSCGCKFKHRSSSS